MIVELLLAFLLLATAVLAMEVKNLVYAALSLAAMAVVLAIIFFYFSAPYVGVFQLSVFAGAITALFLTTITFTRRAEAEE